MRSDSPTVVTFEGTFCVGKTTQLNYAEPYLEDEGYDVTRIGEDNTTRELVDSLDSSSYAYNDVGPYTESFLWAAHHLEKAEEIARADGDLVLVDRFLHSTAAFQELVLDVPLEDIVDYLFAPFGTDIVQYDLLVVFTADRESIANRFEKREGTEIPDAELERSLRIQRNYETLAEYVSGRVRYVETSGLSEREVWERTRQCLVEHVL